MLIVEEFAKLRTNGKRLLTFLYTSHNLRLDIETLTDGDYAFSIFGAHIYLCGVPY